MYGQGRLRNACFRPEDQGRISTLLGLGGLGATARRGRRGDGQMSVCSDITSASSASMPRSRTVLSSLVCLSSRQARRLPVRRSINITVVRRRLCVPYPAGSRPMSAAPSSTRRPCWRVVRCSPGRLRLGSSRSPARSARSFCQADGVSRVVSVRSKGAGRPVFWLSMAVLNRRGRECGPRAAGGCGSPRCARTSTAA